MRTFFSAFKLAGFNSVKRLTFAETGEFCEERLHADLALAITKGIRKRPSPVLGMHGKKLAGSFFIDAPRITILCIGMKYYGVNVACLAGAVSTVMRVFKCSHV
jgi:hypothetical protein